MKLINNLKSQFFAKKSSKPAEITKWNNTLNTDINYRLLVAILVLVAGFSCIFIANNVITHINTNTWQYEEPGVIPVYPPIGNDFRVGLYRPAENLVKSGFKSIGPDDTYPSVYPPLVGVISLPYLLFSHQTAYLIHVGLLILANIICLALASLMAKEYVLSKLGMEDKYTAIISVFIFFAMAIYTFSSFSFAYSMERGNVDIFAIFFFMLAMWCLLKKPDKIWLQVILLSIAVHFKIYPAALFIILLFKHGKKLILPAVVVNLFFLFILGPKMALSFIRSVTASGEGAGVGNAWSGVGNHAAYSFTMGVDTTSGEFLSGTFFVLWAIFTLIPLTLWGIAAIALILKKYSTQNAILLLMVTIPMMDVVPTISVDYRLVIESSAVLLLIALIIKQIIQKHSWFDLMQLAVVMFLLLMIGRSYAFFDESLFVFRNKYVWVLLLEVVMVVNIIKNQKDCYSVHESGG